MGNIRTEQLCFGSLEDMDGGRLGELLKSHLSRIASDCMDRPADKRARKVLLEFEATPEFDTETMTCERVKLQVKARSKTPDYQSKVYEMRPTKGGFAFNADCPDRLDQPMLDGMSSDDPEY